MKATSQSLEVLKSLFKIYMELTTILLCPFFVFKLLQGQNKRKKTQNWVGTEEEDKTQKKRTKTD